MTSRTFSVHTHITKYSMCSNNNHFWLTILLATTRLPTLQQHAIKGMVQDQLAPTQLVQMLIAKCCVYISAKPLSLCTQTGPLLYCCPLLLALLLCLPTAANLYIVGIPGCIVLLVLIKTSKNVTDHVNLAVSMKATSPRHHFQTNV